MKTSLVKSVKLHWQPCKAFNPRCSKFRRKKVVPPTEFCEISRMCANENMSKTRKKVIVPSKVLYICKFIKWKCFENAWYKI